MNGEILLTRLLVVFTAVLPGACASPARSNADSYPASLTTWEAERFDPTQRPQTHDESLDELHKRTPKHLQTFLPAPGINPETLDPNARKAIEPSYRINHNDRTPTGLLRVYERLQEPDAEWTMFMSGFEPNGAFIPNSWWETFGWQNSRQAASNRETRETWVTDREDVILGIDSRDISLDAGILLRMPAPRSENDPEPVGIIVHFNAMTPNEYEFKSLARLVERGWVIASIDTRITADPPNKREIEQAYAQLNDLRRDLYFQAEAGLLAQSDATELDEQTRRAIYEKADRDATAQVSIPESAFLLSEQSELEDHAVLIAQAVDRTIAQNVDAASAAVAHLDAHRPDLAGKPIIVAGFSAGSLTAPAVAARLSPRVRALLLVGAGADLFTIARTSNLTSAGLELSLPNIPGPDKQTESELARMYREHTNLDPHTLAPELEGLPTLVILASFDKVIPASQGQLLLDRLVGEEVIKLPLTHNGIFGVLPGLADKIGDWVDKNPAP